MFTLKIKYFTYNDIHLVKNIDKCIFLCNNKNITYQEQLYNLKLQLYNYKKQNILVIHHSSLSYHKNNNLFMNLIKKNCIKFDDNDFWIPKQIWILI